MNQPFSADLCRTCINIIESGGDIDASVDIDPGQVRSRIETFLLTVPFHTITGHGVTDGLGHWQECDCCQEKVLDTWPVVGLP